MKRRARVCVVAAATALSLAVDARAEPLRLRGDALAEARAPAGLLVLQGEDRARPWLDAEALVWGGAGTTARSGLLRRAEDGDVAAADVLVLAFRLREPKGVAELRGGRFVYTSGAIRPVHLDGASALARAPWGGTFEAFGGTPVVPRFGTAGESPHEWIAGGRAAQAIGSRATVGASYYQRRDRGELADEEIGLDAAAVPTEAIDLAARGAYDVASPGIADAMLSIATRGSVGRLEGFATHRSPSRMLPATSLFSVLGDFPSEAVGATTLWRAAPRLDVRASGAARVVGATVGVDAWLRALLRLDDRGDGTLGLELRRQSVSTARWTGVRGTATHPLGGGFRFSTELELAFADHPEGRGVAWPWGLMALAWRSRTGWEAAAAIEGSATPQHRFESDALLRVSRAWEIGR